MQDKHRNQEKKMSVCPFYLKREYYYWLINIELTSTCHCQIDGGRIKVFLIGTVCEEESVLDVSKVHKKKGHSSVSRLN